MNRKSKNLPFFFYFLFPSQARFMVKGNLARERRSKLDIPGLFFFFFCSKDEDGRYLRPWMEIT